MKVKDIPFNYTLYLSEIGAENPRLGFVRFRDDLFIADMSGSMNIQIDAPEPESGNRNLRARGCNFFPLTGLYQFLNAVGKEWWRPAYETDRRPYYANFDGYLTRFSEKIRKLILPQKIVTVVPDGFKKQYGLVYETEGLVSLPALCDLSIASEQQAVEGSPAPKFAAARYQRYNASTRTAFGSSFASFAKNGAIVPRGAAETHIVYPVIRIDPEAEVYEDDFYGSKCYVPKFEQEDCSFSLIDLFSGNF